MKITGNNATQPIDTDYVNMVGNLPKALANTDKPEVKTDENNEGMNILQANERSVVDAIERANRVTIDHTTRAEFTVHERTKDIMVKIIDTETNEVIREFPPKKFLDLIAKLWDLSGILVDERR